MFRSRLLWKLYAGYAILIVLTALVVGTLVGSSIVRETLAETDRALRSDATILGQLAIGPLIDATGEDLEQHVRQLASATGSRLTVIGTDGVVLADSLAEPETLDNHGMRPEVVAAREGEVGSADRLSRTLGMRMRYMALALRDEEGTIRGFVRAALPLVSIEARLAAVRRLVALGAALATIAALALAFVVAQRVTQPLRAMTAAAQALAEGDDSRRVVGADRSDELGSLANAFNVMRARLRDQLATATLEQSRLAAILGSMVEGVVAVDGEERVVHMNQVAADLLGVAPAKVAGRPIWEITRLHGVTEALRAAMTNHSRAERELRLAGSTDQIIEVRAMPLRNSTSELSGAVVVLDDVTTVRRLETVRQDFVANVSHELKTPVTAIRGLAETMIDDPEMPEQTAQGFLARIREQSLRLSSLVVDLLSLSRLDGDPGGLQSEPIDIQEPVRAAVRALGPASDAKNVHIAVTLPDVPVRCLAESRALEEAVTNLLDNAIKYSPEGGTVDVRVQAGDDIVDIAVIDRGIGIAKRHLDRIFERFYRIDKARSRSLGGTGLGLAIVKHIARSLGGDVAVDSEPAAGSNFTLRLPRHRGNAKRPPAAWTA